MAAWRAQAVRYGAESASLRYVMRSDFHQAERRDRAEIIAHALSHIRRVTGVAPDGPDTYGGPNAFRACAVDLRGDAAASMVQKAMLYGEGQYHATHKQ